MAPLSSGGEGESISLQYLQIPLPPRTLQPPQRLNAAAMTRRWRSTAVPRAAALDAAATWKPCLPFWQADDAKTPPLSLSVAAAGRLPSHQMGSRVQSRDGDSALSHAQPCSPPPLVLINSLASGSIHITFISSTEGCWMFLS